MVQGRWPQVVNLAGQVAQSQRDAAGDMGELPANKVCKPTANRQWNVDRLEGENRCAIGAWLARPEGFQIRSLVLYSDAAICLIIPYSSAPKLSNNIIQKGLAFGRDWSRSVVNSGR
jgi:hypothetical protein